MPCKEMKELEATIEHYTERRRSTPTPNQDRSQDRNQERRVGTDRGFRAGEAKFAYIVLNHRQHCAICRG